MKNWPFILLTFAALILFLQGAVILSLSINGTLLTSIINSSITSIAVICAAAIAIEDGAFAVEHFVASVAFYCLHYELPRLPFFFSCTGFSSSCGTRDLEKSPRPLPTTPSTDEIKMTPPPVRTLAMLTINDMISHPLISAGFLRNA